MALNANDLMRGMNHFMVGDVDAWMMANADNRAWNACAIVKGEKYVYFRKHLKYIRVKKSILKENW